MANSKSRLGRGLGGLISSSGGESSAKQGAGHSGEEGREETGAADGSGSGKAAGVASVPGYREIPVASVAANPYQPRREMQPEQVEELVQSIRSEGLLQPIVVREKGEGFELIAGERRLRAFQQMEFASIPARIIEASDASSAALALIENLQRENLNPIDEAHGYASLLRDFDLTQERAADRVGKGRATVANALRLLSLEPEIQGFLSRRLLSTGHAKVLLGLEAENRKLLARRIIETGMSVREAERQARRLKAGEGSGAKPSKKAVKAEAEATALRDLEKRLGEQLGTRVAVKHGQKKGRILIDYFGNEDLERILEKLGVRG